MSEQECMLIPFGYRVTSGEDHAAVIQFQRLDPLNFRLTYFNTGSGVDHTNSFTTFCRQALYDDTQPIQYTDIELGALVGYSIISNILSAPYISHADETAAIHALCKPFEKLVLKDGTARHELQTNGTSSHSCLEALLSSHVSRSLFLSFSLFVTRKALQMLSFEVEANPEMNILFETGSQKKTELENALNSTLLTLNKLRLTHLGKLNGLLLKKNKNASQIRNFEHYFKKKISQKLNAEELDYVKRNESDTKPSLVSFFWTSKPNLSDRAQKAHLAHCIHECDHFISIIHTVLSPAPV